MGWKTRGGLLATALALAGLGLFASGGFGGDQTPSLLSGRYATVKVAMKPSGGQARSAAAAGRTAKVTHLISADPIDVPAGEEIVAIVRCSKRQGLPLSGGAIAPPAPAEVAIHVLSAFNPNGGNTPPRSFYVGVRNLGASPEQWLATLTCEKGVKGG